MSQGNPHGFPPIPPEPQGDGRRRKFPVTGVGHVRPDGDNMSFADGAGDLSDVAEMMAQMRDGTAPNMGVPEGMFSDPAMALMWSVLIRLQIEVRALARACIQARAIRSHELDTAIAIEQMRQQRAMQEEVNLAMRASGHREPPQQEQVTPDPRSSPA